jgi:hypothetical protein
MTKTYRATFLVVLSVFIAFACSKDSGGNNGVDCSTVSNKAFAADVNPIIQSSCNIAGCHAAGSINGPGPLTNYTQIFSARSQIRDAVQSGRMPQGSSLSAAQKNSIICWIDGGAPNN